MMRRVLTPLGITLMSSLPFSGCGEAGPALVSVTGTVVQDGKPLADAAVMFLPDGSSKDARPAEDTTGADGKYKLLTGGRFGAVPGKYHVTVTKTPSGPEANATEAFKDDPFMAGLSAGTGARKGGSAGVEFSTDREITTESPQVQDIDVKVKAAEAVAKPR